MNAIWNNEPCWDNPETSPDFADGVSWYHTIAHKKDKKKWILDYMKQEKMSKDDIRHVKATNTKLFGAEYGGYGIVARLLTRGCTIVPEVRLTTLQGAVMYLILAGKDELNKKSKETTTPKKTIQEYTKDKINAIISFIEPRIDDIFSGEMKKAELTPYKWYEELKIKSVHCPAIIGYIQSQLDEVTEAEDDEQLAEGYSFLTAKELTKIQDSLSLMVSDCKRWADNNKTSKKPRKKKIVPLTKLVKGMKYKVSDETWKLKSVDPTRIIGSDILYVFNTKDRFLSIFIADGVDGLSVKGSAIRGFDKTKSTQRKLRKPEAVLPVIISSGKRAINNAIKTCTTKEQPVTGRINNHMIIMKAI